MKLSESVLEGFGNQEVDSSVEDLTNKLATKIKILNDLKNDSTDCTDETVDKVIEETFKDKSIAKSFGEENVAAENDSIIAGWSLTQFTPPQEIIINNFYLREQGISLSPPVPTRGRWRRKT